MKRWRRGCSPGARSDFRVGSAPSGDIRRIVQAVDFSGRCVNVFFFGVGYCAEALIRAHAWNRAERHGAGRTSGSPSSARRGVDALCASTARRPSPGSGRRSTAPRRSSSRSRRAAPATDRSTASRRRSRPPRRFAASSIIRPSAFMASMAGPGSTRRAPTLTRSHREAWRGFTDEARWIEAGRARGIAVDILRLPGIYGPGRNALVEAQARRGAPDRQARPCRQPRPCRRHRRGHAPRSDARPRGPDLERRRRRARPAAGRDRLCGVAARASTPPPEEPFDDGEAVADGGELLRRREARLQRQGQGAARLQRPPIRPTARGSRRCSRRATDGAGEARLRIEQYRRWMAGIVCGGRANSAGLHADGRCRPARTSFARRRHRSTMRQ